MLDATTGALLCDGKPVALRPKTWHLLVCLAGRPGVLVSTNELLDSVWRGVAVTPNALTNVVGELRRALDDTGPQPRVIETVRGRGYRFIASVRPTGQPPIEGPLPASVDGFVGRDAELAALASAWRSAQRGQRRVVFLNGEPGVGKTTLVERFLSGLPGGCFVRVHCAESSGPSDPYTPILHILEECARGTRADTVRDLFERFAPTWLQQIPWLIDENRLEKLRRMQAGVGPARVQREGAVLLEEITRLDPLVIVIEDAHWADPATIELLSTLLQRGGQARLLLVATYRPIDALVRSHPVASLVARHRNGAGVQFLPLAPFSLKEVERWLERELADSTLAAELAPAIGRHSGGNPLFLQAIAAQLRAEGLLCEGGGRWRATMDLAHFTPRLPDDLRDLIEMQVGVMPEETLAILEAASVLGGEVAVDMLSELLGEARDSVEDRLHALAARSIYVRALAPSAVSPAAEAYEFTHALYQRAFHDRIAPSRRRLLHRRAGGLLEAVYGASPSELSTRIALHFEAAGDLDCASRHREHAATVAFGRFAYDEGVRELEISIRELEGTPGGVERSERLARMSLALGNGYMRLRGYADRSVSDAFERAGRHAADAGNGRLEVRASIGLMSVRTGVGNVRAAVPLVERQLDIVTAGRCDLSQYVYTKAGHLHLLLGDLARARDYFEIGASHTPVPGVPVLVDGMAELDAWRALAHVHLASLSQAWLAAGACMQRGEEAGLPWGRGMTMYLLVEAAIIAQDWSRAVALVERCVELQRAHDLGTQTAIMQFLSLYLRGRRANAGEAAAEMREQLALHHRLGERWHSVFHLLLLAETEMRGGALVEAAHTLDQAFEFEAWGGERRFHAELWRLRAEHHSATGDESVAESCLRHAIDTARASGCRLFEVRSTTSLARRLVRQGRSDEAVGLVTEARARLPEPGHGADAIEAAALLRELTP